jgi:hypothetical protein
VKAIQPGTPSGAHQFADQLRQIAAAADLARVVGDEGLSLFSPWDEEAEQRDLQLALDTAIRSLCATREDFFGEPLPEALQAGAWAPKSFLPEAERQRLLTLFGLKRT